MKITKLLEEKWNDSQFEILETLNPSLNDIYLAVEKINKKNNTSLYFEVNENNILTIVGNGEYFILFICFNIDEKIFNLINENQQSDLYLNIISGGQMGSYSFRQCIHIDIVKYALLYFYENGDICPELNWDLIE